MTTGRDPIDRTLDAAWRAHVGEEPPSALDERLLAAAHRAVASGPRPAVAAAPRWRTWAPLAVAATIGAIAFGVVQLAPRENDATHVVVGDVPVAVQRAPVPPEEAKQAPNGVTAREPAPAPTAPAASAAPAASTQSQTLAAPAAPAEPAASAQPQPPRPAPQRFANEVRARADAPKTQSSDRRTQAAPARAVGGADEHAPSSSTAADAASAQDALRKQQGAGVRKESEAAQTLNAPAPQPFPGAAAPMRDPATGTSAAQAKTAPDRSPDDYVGEIVRLRNEGRDADAALALAAFRAAYPDADAHLPENLRAWARGVPRR